MRGSIICLIIILLVYPKTDVQSQQLKVYSDTSISVAFNKINHQLSQSGQNKVTLSRDSYFAFNKVHILPKDYYLSNLSFFCNKEIQLERATKVALRFRLGSVAYTDKMENKNSFTPQLQVQR